MDVYQGGAGIDGLLAMRRLLIVRCFYGDGWAFVGIGVRANEGVRNPFQAGRA